MASIERRTVEGGKFEYRARWRDAEGKSRRSKWFARKFDAERHRDTVAADLHRGAYVDLSNTTTVAEYAHQWAAARPYRAATRHWVDILINTHIGGTPLGSRPLVKVKPSEIQAWATGRASVLGASTLRRSLGQLRSIFATAVQDGLLARNPVLPANRLSLPQPEHRPVVPLTVEQVRRLADAAPDRYRALVIAQAGLGLRIAELLALRVEDVNFLRREVHVEWQLDKNTLERVVVKTPKSRRMVPLPQVVAEALAQHMAAYPPGEDGTFFTPERETPSGPRRARTTEGRIRHQKYGKVVRAAAERAGLPPTSTHDLRHHYACVLLHAGESPHAVAERLGHTDATLVLTVYGHEMPNQEDRTRRAVDAAWAEAAVAERAAR